MSNTVKHTKFCSEPVGEKPVSEVPGVGRIAAQKLKDMGYPKAKDLYKKLAKFKFNEGKLRVWMSLTCKGARVSTIYKALMSWHHQFGAELTSGEDSSNTDDFEERPSSSQIGRRSAPRKKQRSSVQFNLPANEEQMNDTITNTASNQHSLATFLMSFSNVVQNISQELHTDFMADIINVIKDYEKKSKEINMQTN